MTYPLVLHVTTAIPGDGFDGWQNYWNLWWVKTALLDLQQNPYFTNYLYHPTGYSLLFHTLNIFNGLLSLPIQLGFGVTVAYNFVVFFSFVMGGYGTYLLALHVLEPRARMNDHVVAFAAGVVFTFSPFHFAHLLGHMNMISLEWLPFYVLALVRSLSGQRMRFTSRVVLPVLFLVLTALCDWHFVLYLLIFTMLYLGYKTWVGRRFGKQFMWTALILLLSGIILSPLLAPMMIEGWGAPAHLVSPFDITVRLSADLLAFLTPNELHPLWGQAASRLSESFTSGTSERMVFAGYVPLALAAYALWRTGRRAAFWLASTMVFLILSLGPYLHVAGRETPLPLPYLALYQLVPFFRIGRAVSRFDAMVMLSLAALVALGLRAAAAPLPGTRKRVLALAVVGLVCLEFLSVPYPMSEVEVPHFYRRLATDEEEYAILELPMNWDRPAHLLYQTVHQKPLLAGYVSRPSAFPLVERVPVLQHFRFLGADIIGQSPSQIAPEVFRYLGIRYVILHEDMLPPGGERDAVLGLVGEVFGDQLPLYQDAGIIVYQVGDQEPRSPLLVLGSDWGERWTSQGEPRRDLGTEATCVIITPAGEASMAFTAFSAEGARSLELSLNEQSVGNYEIAAQAHEFVSAPLVLKEGLNVVRLRDKSGGEPAVVFTSVDLRDYRPAEKSSSSPSETPKGHAGRDV